MQLTMTQEQPILSISIPTYNRPKQVVRLVRGILPQLPPNVEVIIRDDSTNNETETIIHQLFEQFKKSDQLSYFKGDKLGMDRATLFVVEKARGKYVWTFGDDDEMAPGAIQRVIELVLLHPNISFMWANYICIDGVNSVGLIREEGFFRDGNEALEILTNKMTLLSTFIFKKENAMRAWKIAEKHIGSWWSIMALVLESMADGDVYFLKGPFVINHLEAHGASDFELGVRVFGINLPLIFREFYTRFSRRAMRKFFSKHFGDMWRGILVNRARYPVGIVRSGLIWKLFSLYWSFPEFWIALPFFLMPRFIIVPIYRGYKVFFDHRQFKLMRSK